MVNTPTNLKTTYFLGIGLLFLISMVVTCHNSAKTTSVPEFFPPEELYSKAITHIEEANSNEITSDIVFHIRKARMYLARIHDPIPEIQNLLKECQEFIKATRMYDGFYTGESWGTENLQWMIDVYKFMPEASKLRTICDWFAGKLYYHIGLQMGQAYHYDKARHYLLKRQEFLPDGRILQMYLSNLGINSARHAGKEINSKYVDQRVPAVYTYSFPELKPTASKPPYWAKLAHKANAYMLRVIHYWVQERQIHNGAYGAGWGDDPEMLRWWGQAILGINDPIAKEGMKRLVDGMWSKSGIIENGYQKEIGDVEHAAEPTTDTQPLMLVYDYGNPEYVERNMLPAQLFKTLWTDVNPDGYRLFKSMKFSSRAIDETPRFGVDVLYNAFPAKHLIWYGWYNRDPELIRIFSEWMNSWVQAALSTERGKPAGILPPAIGFRDFQIGGYGSDWYDPEIGYDYTWHGKQTLMLEVLLAAYAFTQDSKYLQPLEMIASYAIDHPKKPEPSCVKEGRPTDLDKVEGEPEWIAKHCRKGLATVLAKRRYLLNNDTTYDRYLLENGSAYMKYTLTKDIAYIEQGCQELIDHASHNYEMFTTENLYTDRVYLNQSAHLLSMYTGGIGSQIYYPSFAVTWDHVNKDFTALVETAASNKLHIQLFHFGKEDIQPVLLSWQLEPGTYKIILTNATSGQAIYSDTVNITHRGTEIPFTLPGQTHCQLYIVKDSESDASISTSPPQLPDLALSMNDIRFHFPDKTPHETSSQDESTRQSTSESTSESSTESSTESLSETSRENSAASVNTEPYAEITFHNIGSASSNPAEIKYAGVYSDDTTQELGSFTLESMPAPEAFVPVRRVHSIFLKSRKNIARFKALQVTIEQPEKEITKRNNQVIIPFPKMENVE